MDGNVNKIIFRANVPGKSKTKVSLLPPGGQKGILHQHNRSDIHLSKKKKRQRYKDLYKDIYYILLTY